MVKKRSTYLDVAKGLLIILVLLGHIGRDYQGDSDILQSIAFFIYIFHMPAFIFISGYLSKNFEKNRSKGFDAILQFVLFQIVWCVVEILFFKTSYSIYTIFEPGPALWYILALGIWRYFLEDLLKIKHIFFISLGIGILFVCTTRMIPLLAIPRIINFLPFFLLGYYCDRNHLEKIKKIPLQLSFAVLAVFLIGSYFIITKTNINFVLLLHNYEYKQVVNGDANILYIVFANALSYVCAAIAMVAFFRVCYLFEDNRAVIRFGSKSLYIYILSNYIQVVLYVLSHRYGFCFSNDYINYGISLIFIVITLFICTAKPVTDCFDAVVNKWLKLIKKR